MSRRQQNYVDFEVQTMLLRRMSLHWFLFVVANLVAIFIWCRLFEAPAGDMNQMLTLCMDRIVPIVLVSAAILPVFIYDSLKLSNRFTGPMTRVRKTIAMMVQGEKPAAIEFRDSDCWQSLAQDLNQVLNLKPASLNPDSNSAPKQASV